MGEEWREDCCTKGQKAAFMFLGSLSDVDHLYDTVRMWEEEMNYCNLGTYEEYYCVNENLEFAKSGQTLMELHFNFKEKENTEWKQ